MFSSLLGYFVEKILLVYHIYAAILNFMIMTSDTHVRNNIILVPVQVIDRGNVFISVLFCVLCRYTDIMRIPNCISSLNWGGAVMFLEMIHSENNLYHDSAKFIQNNYSNIYVYA